MLSERRDIFNEAVKAIGKAEGWKAGPVPGNLGVAFYVKGDRGWHRVIVAASDIDLMRNRTDDQLRSLINVRMSNAKRTLKAMDENADQA